MGKVEAITVEGLDLWFNSSDHLPQHFHARRPDEWEIRVNILETTKTRLVYTQKWGQRSPDGRTKRVLRERTVSKRVALLEEWERKVRSWP